MKIKTKDPIVQRIMKKMDERSIIGQEKYGGMMMDEIKDGVKDLNRFLIDIQEELMDAVLYIESARECLREEVEEAMLNWYNEEELEERMNIIGQNGNTGEHYWTQNNT